MWLSQNSYPQHHKTFGNAHIGGNCKNDQVLIFIGSHWILTFLKILSPLVFMILIGLMNYKYHLKELEKQQYNGWTKSSNFATISKLDKTCTLRFVLSACNNALSCKEYVYLPIVMSFYCNSPKKKVSSIPKQMRFSPNSKINPLCYGRDCVITKVRLSTMPPSITCWNVKKISTCLHICLHDIHMNGYPKILVNNNNLIYTQKDKPPSNHNILGFLYNLFTYTTYIS